MNKRLFSIALLISAFPILAFADAAGISLKKEDFTAAERISRDGKSLVKVKLSKSGKAKFKKLNQHFVNKNIHFEAGEISSDFKLKVPINGSELEMGPYSTDETDKIVTEINSTN